MVAPAGELSNDTIPFSVGLETAGHISTTRGRTSTIYNAAGATLMNGDRMIRVVQRHRGSKIIKAQNGKTKRLLSLKIEAMSFTSEKNMHTDQRAISSKNV